MPKLVRSLYCSLKGYPKGSIAWWFSRVPGSIGEYTSIGSHCNIEGTVGSHCNIQNHVNIFGGVTIGDYVFVGPSVTFTNVNKPRAGISKPYEKTVVKNHAMIGANATILPGITIGVRATIGAGAVVTKDVPAGVTVAGNPAREL